MKGAAHRSPFLFTTLHASPHMHYKSTPLYKRFILVYRLAIDAKTRKGDGAAG